MSETKIFLPDHAVVELTPSLVKLNWLNRFEFSALEASEIAQENLINSVPNEPLWSLFYCWMPCKYMSTGKSWKSGKCKAYIDSCWIFSSANMETQDQLFFQQFDLNKKFLPSKHLVSNSLIEIISDQPIENKINANVNLHYLRLQDADVLSFEHHLFVKIFQGNTISVERLTEKIVEKLTNFEQIKPFWTYGVDGRVLIPNFKWLSGKLYLRVSYLFVEYKIQIDHSESHNDISDDSLESSEEMSMSLLDDIRQFSDS
jgi:hypothetical protein